jgi:hypothetical protein
MDQLYPKSFNGLQSPNQIVGHIAVSLSSNKALQEVKQVLKDLALSHPKIGIGRVKVPKNMMIVQDIITEKRRAEPYLMWHDYVALCSALGIQ